ncbi:MAG: hypothetical protein ABI481_12250 [Pyrinomonadaceae bacterium]
MLITDLLANGGDDDFVGGKADPAFFGDSLVADPDGEFAAAAFDQFDVNTERIFDSGRRTGGPWSIRSSDLTETNHYFIHNFLFISYYDRGPSS